MVAIRVEGLGKCYRLAGQQAGRFKYRTLRDSLAGLATAPFRRRDRGGEFWALRDVDFAVEPGEVIGVIGRNGAGKSTLLKVLSRITRPTQGRVRLRGRVGSLLEVGTGFHPELTGRENVFLNGSILGMSRREIGRRFDAIVAFAEVDQFLDTPVKRYSSGMYVRLAFAVAAHLEPEILIVDEVLAVGDAKFQQKCLGKMGEIAAGGGNTVLFVSHNMTAVQQLCRRSIQLAGGRVAFDGPTDKAVQRYLSDASSSSDGRFDLREHPARQPGKAPVITGLTMRGEGGRPATTFQAGGPLEVEMVLEPAAPVAGARAAVAVEDAFGRRIFTVASYFGGDGLPDLRAPARVVCRVPRLQLGEGRYLLSVSVGTKYGGLLDSLDGAAWFDVVWDNNYGNGEPYHPVYGPVLVDSEWSVV